MDCDDGVLSSGIAGTLDAPATADKARCSGMGKTFPRFSARRRIPAHAVELKKYCWGIEPLTSTCDNEHTTAPLGESMILGILDPPCCCPLGSSNITCDRPLWAMQTGFRVPAPMGRGPSVLRSWAWLKRLVIADEGSEEGAERIIGHAEAAGDVLPDCDAGLFADVVDSIGEIHI
jgi:hypothetical protein